MTTEACDWPNFKHVSERKVSHAQRQGQWPMLNGPGAGDADASSWQLPRLRLANMELLTLLQVLAAAALIGGGDITQPSAKGHKLDSQPWSLATTSV